LSPVRDSAGATGAIDSRTDRRFRSRGAKKNPQKIYCDARRRAKKTRARAITDPRTASRIMHNLVTAPAPARVGASLKVAARGARVSSARTAAVVPVVARHRASIVSTHATEFDGVSIPEPARPPKSLRGASSASSAGARGFVGAAAGAIDVIPGDYRIGGVLLSVAMFLGPVCHLWTQFGVHGLLGGFLAFQASRVRFRFSDTDLDVVFIEPGADDATAASLDTDSSGDNKLQGGGANKWSFDSVVNWEFWFPGFPVLVYYKENQTKAEGQPHFFPIIMDGKKLYEVMLEKMPKSVNEKPPVSEWNLDTAFESTSLGRSIKENLSDEQKEQLKNTMGFPFLDN